MKYINKKNIALVIIFILGILIRVSFITKMPNALNCDEASAGYEAFSILNYKIDRNRKFFTCIFSILGKWTKLFIKLFNDSIY